MNADIAKERISYVARPDSITSSEGDFLATHVSVKKLKVLDKFELSPAGGNSYTEEELFKDFISNPEDKHQFIAVYGQSGTGKSHLIRWFEARYKQNKPKDEVILFIRRSDNTLKGTIRQLLEKPEVQDISNKEVYERLAKASLSVEENKLKDMIYHNFIIEINNDSDEQDIQLTTVRKKRLIAFLNNEVVHDYLMSSSGPVERMYSKIAEHTLVDRDTVAQFEANDFIVSPELYDNITNAGADPKAERMARELMSDEEGPIEAQKIANYLNQFVGAVIQRCAGIEPGDFKQIFLDIRKELYVLDKVREDTLLVSVMHVNNETGIIQPVKEIGDALNQKDVLFHVDATQSCGKLVDEIRGIKYNMLSFSAHKLMGPQGVGVLVLKKNRYKLPPVKNIMYGGQQEHGIRPGTIPVALVAGCGKACEIASAEYKENAKKAIDIKKSVLQELDASGVEYSINGDPEYCVDTTINVSLKGVSSEALMISTKQFCGVSNGSACTSKSYSPSYVLVAMGLDNDTIECSLRISWGVGTNKDEAIKGIRGLLDVAKQFSL